MFSEVKEIKVFKSIKQAFLIGADIDIVIVLKNMNIKRIHLGPIIRYDKFISMIKEVSRRNCIKFCVIE